MTDEEISLFSSVSKRICIWSCFKRALSIREAQQDLKCLFGDDAPGYGTIQFWYSEFSRGRENVCDNPRSGRPKELDLVGSVRGILEENPYSSAQAISLALGVSKRTVLKILHDDLGLGFFKLQWVPHTLSQEQRATRVSMAQGLLDELTSLSPTGIAYVMTADESWFNYDNPHSSMWAPNREAAGTRPNPGMSRRKTMVSVFWNFTGFFVIEALPEGATYTADYVCSSVIPKLESVLLKQRPTLGLQRTKLHWDNARPHVARQTLEHLAEKGVITLSHPPYSPDISPSDFFLFGYLKHMIEGRHFSSEEELVAALCEICATISKEVLSNVLRGWKDRLLHVISSGGEYCD